MKATLNANVTISKPTIEEMGLPYEARVEVTIADPRFDAFEGLKLVCLILGSDDQYYDANILPRITSYLEGGLGENYAKMVEHESERIETILVAECEWYRNFNYDFNDPEKKALSIREDDKAIAILASEGIDKNNPAPDVETLDFLELASIMTRYAIYAHNSRVSNACDGGEYAGEVSFAEIELVLDSVPYPV